MNDVIRKYRRRALDIYATQHDGTDETAEVIAAWVRGHGGMATAMLTGTVEEEPDKAFVHVENPRVQKIASPGYWVVMTPDNQFFVLSDRDFKYLYDEIPDDYIEPPS